MRLKTLYAVERKHRNNQLKPAETITKLKDDKTMNKRKLIKQALNKYTDEHDEIDINKALVWLHKKGLNIAAGEGNAQTIWYEELALKA